MRNDDDLLRVSRREERRGDDGKMGEEKRQTDREGGRCVQKWEPTWRPISNVKYRL